MTEDGMDIGEIVRSKGHLAAIFELNCLDRSREQHRDVVLRAATLDNAWVRRHAVQRLAEWNDPAAPEVLLRAVRDPEAMVRCVAAARLDATRADHAAALLVAMSDPVEDVRQAAACRLDVEFEAHAAAMVEAMGDPSWEVRLMVAGRMSRACASHRAALRRAAIDDSSPEVRARCVRRLDARIEDDLVVAIVASSDPDEQVRAAARERMAAAPRDVLAAAEHVLAVLGDRGSDAVVAPAPGM